MKNKEGFEIIDPSKNTKEANIVSYLVKLILVIIIAVSVISAYYTWIHKETWEYGIYLLYIIIFYWIYKFIKVYFSSEKIIFSPLWLAWYTLINLIVVSWFVFDSSNWGWLMALLFKILWFAILPFLITIICYSFARMLLKKIQSFEIQDNSFKFLMSIWFWFTCFLTILVTFALFGLYNSYVVFAVLAIFAWLWYKELIYSFKNLWTYRIEFNNHKLNWTIWESINLNLLSAEFAFIVLSFLISVNFINIIRPMPIWWDDLGSYMNIPQIMANSAWMPKGIWFMARQLFTWIWYMFHSAPQAFFLNQVWWILSIIAIIVITWDLLKTSKNKHLSIPIILATMFYAMPMVIFQQAKDMKLDPALFFVSIIWMYLIYKIALKYISSSTSNASENTSLFNNILPTTPALNSKWVVDNILENKDYLTFLAIIWSIVWLAFAIKFTTLMLIIWLLGVIFYVFLWYISFLWYFALFVWLFTRFHLWDMMNVNYPKDNIAAVNNFSYALIIIALLLFAFSYIKNSTKIFSKTITFVLVFCVWIIAPLVPWIAKNISETPREKLSIGTMLNWTPDTFNPDFGLVFSKTELDEIKKASITETMDSNGKTKNEDLWRYFWYEDWINNYLKLPWNLTMQSNQGWEYTEITFFFLALIPILLLFLTYRSPVLPILLLVMTWIGAYYLNPKTWTLLTDFFTKQTLPYGYIYITLCFFLPLTLFVYWLRNDKLSSLFKINWIFFALYTLIFVVAAYWIVWYWIALYFALLLMIGISLSYLSEVDNDEVFDWIKILWSFALFVIIFTYFISSSLPHWMTNLAQAWFSEFKAWKVNQEEGIFASHPDYFIILAHLNVSNADNLVNKAIKSLNEQWILSWMLKSNLWEKPSIAKLEEFLRVISFDDLTKYKINTNTAIILRDEARPILNILYNSVLYPNKDIQNKDKIFRIWTFLTYFISNNRTRYYDDSLVNSFWKYFYHENPDVAVERMKKVGLKYLLTDLNAATIDKDPRHDLTNRYEQLLRTFKSNKLELIQTDSICLRIALEEKDDNYMTYAWVNYESYSWSNVINRNQKQIACYQHAFDLIKENKVDEKHYAYLLPIVQAFKNNNVSTWEQASQILQSYINHWWLALFRIK